MYGPDRLALDGGAAPARPARNTAIPAMWPAKCPKWLVANWYSQPGPTRRSGVAMTPATAVTRSSRSRDSLIRTAAERTLARSVRSMGRISQPSASASAARAASGRRAGTMTWAPAARLRAGFQAQTGIPAGDDGVRAGQVDPGHDVVGGAGGGERRAGWLLSPADQRRSAALHRGRRRLVADLRQAARVGNAARRPQAVRRTGAAGLRQRGEAAAVARHSSVACRPSPGRPIRQSNGSLLTRRGS